MFGEKSLETFSGFEFSLDDPQPSMVNIRDIAVGLGNICRFNGQIRRFYSVAEHSVLVSDLLGSMGFQSFRKFGLLHDAAEAYIGDVIAPIKKMLRVPVIPEVFIDSYDRLTGNVEAAIDEAFDLGPSPSEVHGVVKKADFWALRIEAFHLCKSKGYRWNWPLSFPTSPPDGVEWVGGLTPSEAAYLFELRWEELS